MEQEHIRYCIADYRKPMRTAEWPYFCFSLKQRMLGVFLTLLFIAALVTFIIGVTNTKYSGATVIASGNNGSCPCSNYCARNWAGEITAQQPSWIGATCTRARKLMSTDPDVYEDVSCDFYEIPPESQILCYCAESNTPFYPNTDLSCSAPLQYPS